MIDVDNQRSDAHVKTSCMYLCRPGPTVAPYP